MNKFLDNLQKQIEPVRQQVIKHKAYAGMHDLEDVRIFMEHHVFAVWDFMSLLKTLQNNLTCTSVPWFPTGDAETRYLINEIVAGEESDVDAGGNRKSHFEIYLDAMAQCGADTKKINNFIKTLQQGIGINQALKSASLPQAVKEFVEFTFEVINSGKPHVQAAVFTFGREDLIPGMFFSIINDLHKNFPEDISIFKYYLERHIEVDGDHHSHLALQMTANLCGNNAAMWEEATIATTKSLQMRVALWDAVHLAVKDKKESIAAY